MTAERERGENTANPDFTIVGQGNIGEKARQLMNKTPALKDIGFNVHRRTILSEGYFDRFFQRNGLGANLREVADDSSVVDRIKAGFLPFEDFAALRRTCLSYGLQVPIIIRSSAEGDARGTGTYASELSENNPQLVRKALQKVLSSYFSESAIAFRRDAKTGEGFGVIIEPVAGQEQTRIYEDGAGSTKFFAPILSGFGYTSTLQGEGYISAVPGLGGGVDSKEGLQLTRKFLAEADGNLINYLLNLRTNQWKRDKLLLRKETNGKVYAFPRYNRRGDVAYQSMDLYRNNNFGDLNMFSVFGMMSEMETVFGKPQYFEWAMTIESGEPKYWILQIADVNKKVDNFEFGNFGQVLFMAHTVTGSGMRNCGKIVQCWNIQDIPALNLFNKENEGYVLMYSSRLTTSVNRSGNLRYADFSNAGVFLEIQDALHSSRSPVAHLGGQLELAGKLFGVLDNGAEVPPNFDEFRSGQHDEGGLSVYNGNIKVVADEKKDKMVLYKQG